MDLAAKPSEIQASVRALAAGGPALRALGTVRIVRALCGAAERLQGRHALAQSTRERLLATHALSAEMVEWGLSTTLGSVEAKQLQRLASGCEAAGAPARLVAVVLAGNLFSASVRAILLPLLSAAPVIVKASARDPVLAFALKEALDEADPEVGAQLAVFAFERTETRAMQALVAQAEAVSVYGSDTAVAAVAALLRHDQRLIEHGHGLSAAYVAAESLRDAAATERVVQRLALDVAAYDQHGCLSPHFVLVEAGGYTGAQGLAQALGEWGLPEMQAVLPRGELGVAARAAELQWRGIAAARGTVHASSGASASWEGRHQLRVSPGYRNVGVYDTSGVSELAARLRVFGEHLKALGVAGMPVRAAEVASAFAGPRPPRICGIGEMQTPAFDADADGYEALHGLR